MTECVRVPLCYHPCKDSHVVNRLCLLGIHLACTLPVCTSFSFWISCLIFKQETRASQQKQWAGEILTCLNWPKSTGFQCTYNIRLQCTSHPVLYTVFGARFPFGVYSCVQGFISFGPDYFKVVNLL